VKEFGAELFFKGRDLFTDRGLTNPAFFRNSREAPLFDYSDEYLHRFEFAHIASLFLEGLPLVRTQSLSAQMVFPFGMACIPQPAVSAYEPGTSDMETGGSSEAQSRESVES
jgi:hypothetical protein